MGFFSKSDKGKIAEYEKLIGDYKKQIEDLEQKLYYDTLTGCKNKTSFKNDMKLYESKTKYVLVAISIDLDKINKKNRENGDAILVSIAKRLTDAFPNVYHYGGTKFNLLINLCDFKEEEITNWYEKTITDYPDIKIFYGIAKSTDGIGLGYFDISQIAIKRMYQDKHIKKPENKDIEEQLEEQKRLETLKKQNEELEEEEYIASARAMFEKMDAIMQRRQKERALYESKKKFESNVFHLPEELGSDVEETFDKKKLCTMWFNKETISFTIDGQYFEYDFYIFPLAYNKPPASLPIVCVIDNREKYKALTGDIIKTGIARQRINVSARFTEDGQLISNIVFDDVTIEVKKETKENQSLYMPKHYGKEFFDELLFPIKRNLNGTTDMAVYKDGEVTVCNGSREHDGILYHFTADSDAIYINH